MKIDDPCEPRPFLRLLALLQPVRATTRRHRALARDLSALNDHLLRDIGLDRIDVRERRK